MNFHYPYNIHMTLFFIKFTYYYILMSLNMSNLINVLKNIIFRVQINLNHILIEIIEIFKIKNQWIQKLRPQLMNK